MFLWIPPDEALSVKLKWSATVSVLLTDKHSPASQAQGVLFSIFLAPGNARAI